MMIAMAKAEYRETGAARHISLDHPLSAADWFVSTAGALVVITV